MALQCPASTSCNPTEEFDFDNSRPWSFDISILYSMRPLWHGARTRTGRIRLLLQRLRAWRARWTRLEGQRFSWGFGTGNGHQRTLSPAKHISNMWNMWTLQQLAIWSVWTLLASHLPIPPQVEQHIIYASNASNASNASGLWQCTLFHRCIIIPSASAFSRPSVSKWMPKHDKQI